MIFTALSTEFNNNTNDTLNAVEKCPVRTGNQIQTSYEEIAKVWNILHIKSALLNVRTIIFIVKVAMALCQNCNKTIAFTVLKYVCICIRLTLHRGLVLDFCLNDV